MSAMLNPDLYQRLQRRFGRVRVASSGIRRQARYFPDLDRPGKWSEDVVQASEQYAVSCPFCGDTRQRLFVSYEYGCFDPRTSQWNYHLYCQNEQCQRDRANRDAFRDMVGSSTSIAVSHAAVVTNQRSAEPPLHISDEVRLPQGIIPLDELQPEHPANVYLVERGFDPRELSRTWQVGYCINGLLTKPDATYRVIAPIYQAGREGQARLAGWQARLLPQFQGPIPEPKYLSCCDMQKASLLYGLSEAIAGKGPVTVVEGITDVWKAGPGAVALFGKSLSVHQRDLLLRHFAGRPIVVLLDTDAQVDAARVRDTLIEARRRRGDEAPVVAAMLPAGREDPATCTRTELEDVISLSLGLTGRTPVAR